MKKECVCGQNENKSKHYRQCDSSFSISKVVRHHIDVPLRSTPICLTLRFAHRDVVRRDKQRMRSVCFLGYVALPLPRPFVKMNGGSIIFLFLERVLRLSLRIATQLVAIHSSPLRVFTVSRSCSYFNRTKKRRCEMPRFIITRVRKAHNIQSSNKLIQLLSPVSVFLEKSRYQ